MPQRTKTQHSTALVTGAARRIGAAIARDLARRGWRVAIHYRRSRDEAEALAAEIRATGGEARAIFADLASPEDLKSLVPRCRDELGAPSCLVNNASEFLVDSVTSLSMETWTTHLDINLKAPVFLARSLFINLPDGVDGNVINIIDQRVWKLTPEFFSYTISKAGLWTATRTLAQALAPRVRVNAIGPGPVLRNVHQTEEDFAAEIRSTLLKRAPSLEDIATALGFILEAPALTGQMIVLDGGQHLTFTENEALAAGRDPAGRSR